MPLSRSFLLTLLLCSVTCLAVACRSNIQNLADLPTPVDLTIAATDVVLTQNAPPPGFNQLHLPLINDGVNALTSWQSETLLRFQGYVTGTPREITATIQLAEAYDLVASARSVKVSSEGDLFVDNNTFAYEAVQLGPDYYVVNDERCFQPTLEDGERALNLNAGSLIGGLVEALPAGQQATINNEVAFLYKSRVEDVRLGIVNLGEGGQIISLAGDLWYAPEHKATIRYYANVVVDNVRLFGSTLPLSGTLTIRYDLNEIGVFPNINVPYGC
ncbi:hypothetical protein MASR2M15_18340 [Anaerolineales bacterium]